MGGKLACRVDARRVPVLLGAWEAADAFLYTAAGQRNRNHTGPFVRFENVPFAMEEILFDPQTSGGLLFAVPQEEGKALLQELKEAGLPAETMILIGVGLNFAVPGREKIYGAQHDQYNRNC